MNYPLLELGGAGRVMNVAVANGFPPETYLPMLRPMLSDYRIVSLLPRALWGDQPVPAVMGSWESDYAADLLEGIVRHNLRGIVGVGHSFGGISTMLAALRAPERFSALVLLDPTIPTPQIIEFFRALRAAGTIGEDFHLASRAIKRQRRFASRDEAYRYFRPRGIFADWDEQALQAYIQKGLLDVDGAVELAWPPEWESYYFKTPYTEPWDLLPRLDGLLPMLFLRGGESDTFTAESAAEVRRLVPRATHIDVPGHGHLFPQTAPDETARLVSGWLNSLQIGSLT